MKFPKTWLDCPPEDADDATGGFYRSVKSKLPSKDDFMTPAELGKFKHAPECQRVGVSLLSTIEDARHQLELFPGLNKHIAKGELLPEHGKLR